MRRLAARLWRDRGGAAAVEFAAAVMPLLLMIFGVLEFGRLLWAREALQQTATNAARCMAMRASSCASAGVYSSSSTQTYIINQAGGLGVTLTNSNIALNNNNSCAGIGGPASGFSTVTLTYTFTSVVPVLVKALNGGLALTATACFPNN